MPWTAGPLGMSEREGNSPVHLFSDQLTGVRGETPHAHEQRVSVTLDQPAGHTHSRCSRANRSVLLLPRSGCYGDFSRELGPKDPRWPNPRGVAKPLLAIRILVTVMATIIPSGKCCSATERREWRCCLACKEVFRHEPKTSF